MGFRAWLARPILIYLIELERQNTMTNDELLTKLGTVASGLSTIGDGVVALKAAVAAAGGTTPEVDAALEGVATSVANIVSILPTAATPTTA
jgi:hypothetical protein